MSRKISVLLVLAIGGCSSGPLISTDYDTTENFQRLHTWAWAPTPPQADGGGAPMAPSSLTHERIRAAIQQELTRKGFAKVSEREADFMVLHHAVIGRHIEVDPYGSGWGEDIRTYDEGTIVVDIISSKDKKLIWRGTAKGAIDPDLTPDERNSRIQDAVRQILEKFPPKPNK
jgi:hypothetical protein